MREHSINDVGIGIELRGLRRPRATQIVDSPGLDAAYGVEPFLRLAPSRKRLADGARRREEIAFNRQGLAQVELDQRTEWDCVRPVRFHDGGREVDDLSRVVDPALVQGGNLVRALCREE